ncbi:MAG TPA: ABC transporter permease subunit [Candidatus Limnocylindria bacterium]|nr:ABC transporter permease subunit [Candidatus Limnocylindria bacterium]
MTAASTVDYRHRRVPPWRDIRVIRALVQVGVLLGVALLVGYLVNNLTTAMAERGFSVNFDFLGRRAGFEIGESPVPYSASDTYAQAFLVGVLNTLFVSFVGIILATVLGVIIGVARLSPNWLVSRVAAGYVELIRNTPLLLQLFLIYFVVLLQLPSVSETIDLFGLVFLNQRGFFVPGPQLGAALWPWLAILAIGIVAAIGGPIAQRRLEARGRPGYGLGPVGLLVLIGAAVGGWILLAPMTFDIPERGRFNFSGGLALSTGFTALLLGLVLYTAGFIAEVVRGGIQAVRRGQVEAARALGLSERDTLRLVVFPQALRVIVPPLTSQYLNLTKNSSLAIAVGYPDLFKVGETMANQTGQPVAVIALVMATYLAISLFTSLLMNLYNRRVQVLER